VFVFCCLDVWSLGVILYMLVCGKPPFQEANDSETLIRIMDCHYDTPNHLSASCIELVFKSIFVEISTLLLLTHS